MKRQKQRPYLTLELSREDLAAIICLVIMVIAMVLSAKLDNQTNRRIYPQNGAIRVSLYNGCEYMITSSMPNSEHSLALRYRTADGLYFHYFPLKNGKRYNFSYVNAAGDIAAIAIEVAESGKYKVYESTPSEIIRSRDFYGYVEEFS